MVDKMRMDKSWVYVPQNLVMYIGLPDQRHPHRYSNSLVWLFLCRSPFQIF